MTDREKVVSGLKHCLFDHAALDILDVTNHCNGCPYYTSSECERDLYYDALELLKDQEPRVLTLEEARTYEVVWPEDKGEGELHPLIVQNNMNDSKYYKYGIHWRVWSARPTEEQRKAVKWDE